MKLTGKVAIVTGAGGGMGRSVAKRFAMEGAKVVIAEIDETSGKATLDIIRAAGGDAIFYKTDVSSESEVQSLVAEAEQKFGKVDVLYNNVAIMHRQDARVHELSSEIWLKLVNINLNSAFYCTKHVITAMLRSGGGSIIMVGSPTALIACAPNDAAYSSSKSGVHALARVIAAAYGKDKIRANIIIPGTMKTEMTKTILEDASIRSSLEHAAMLGRLGEETDVDGLAVFLASDDSAYCTGAFFTADGGLTAM